MSNASKLDYVLVRRTGIADISQYYHRFETIACTVCKGKQKVKKDFRVWTLQETKLLKDIPDRSAVAWMVAEFLSVQGNSNLDTNVIYENAVEDVTKTWKIKLDLEYCQRLER